MLNQLEIYANHLNASTEILEWLRTTGKKALVNNKITETGLEHVLDFFVSSAAPKRLQKMSIVDAVRKAKEWTTSQQKKGKNLLDSDEDMEVIHDFLNGNKIVRLKTRKALQREGFLMSHCVGSYSIANEKQHIYSYRDENNNPHATFEVNKQNGEIVQVKGKGNGPIHPKYIHPIIEFLRIIGLSIRPCDMVNLGYYHIDAKHVPFLKNYKNVDKQMVVIGGEHYAF